MARVRRGSFGKEAKLFGAPLRGHGVRVVRTVRSRACPQGSLREGAPRSGGGVFETNGMVPLYCAKQGVPAVLVVKRRSVGGWLTERARSMVCSTSAALAPDFCRRQKSCVLLKSPILSSPPYGARLCKVSVTLSPGEPGAAGEFGAGRRLLLWAPCDAKHPTLSPKSVAAFGAPIRKCGVLCEAMLLVAMKKVSVSGTTVLAVCPARCTRFAAAPQRGCTGLIGEAGNKQTWEYCRFAAILE